MIDLKMTRAKRQVQLNVSQDSDRITFFLSGDIDEQGAALMKEAFEKLSLDSIKQIVLNFRDITYIGSAGLGKLLLLYKKVTTHGIRISITDTNKEIKDIMYELKLDSLFNIL